MIRVSCHLFLIAVLLGLHVPASCTCAAACAATQCAAPPACPCGAEAADQDSDAAGPGNEAGPESRLPNPVTPRPNCPCLCGSPGYVPCAPCVRPMNPAQAAPEPTYWTNQAPGSEGHLQKIIRPPRSRV
jgi:hypothetical protein